MSEQYPRAALFGTEERTFFSTIRGREYHLSVALPDSYKTSTHAYPVIYVLDGDFNFGVAAGLTRFSNAFRQVPELIIVGIGVGHLRLNVHGMAAVWLGQAIWFILAGAQLCALPKDV